MIQVINYGLITINYNTTYFHFFPLLQSLLKFLDLLVRSLRRRTSSERPLTASCSEKPYFNSLGLLEFRVTLSSSHNAPDTWKCLSRWCLPEWAPNGGKGPKAKKTPRWQKSSEMKKGIPRRRASEGRRWQEKQVTGTTRLKELRGILEWGSSPTGTDICRNTRSKGAMGFYTRKPELYHRKRMSPYWIGNYPV